MYRTVLAAAAALACALFTGNAFAITLDASDIAGGGANGLTVSASPADSLGMKTTRGVTVAGVTGGAGGNEISPGQSITVSSNNPFVLAATRIGLLYDGPEFGDTQEVAKITGTFAGGGTSVALLTNDYQSPNDTVASLTVDGTSSDSLVLSATESSSNTPSEIVLGQVFGSNRLTSLEFETDSGICGIGACNNPSDYGIGSITTTVPAPGTLGLMAIGVLLVGLGLRGRKLV